MNQFTMKSLIAEHKVSCPRSIPGTVATAYAIEFVIEQMINCLRCLATNSGEWDDTTKYLN
jgi:hypothetical protein